jgi:hypothetical protein
MGAVSVGSMLALRCIVSCLLAEGKLFFPGSSPQVDRAVPDHLSPLPDISHSLTNPSPAVAKVRPSPAKATDLIQLF